MKKLKVKKANNQFKKKHDNETQTNRHNVGRHRQNVNVEDTSSFSMIPSCSHGPCLLFSDHDGGRWFACAVYRQSNACKFVAYPTEDGRFDANQRLPTVANRPLEDYGSAKRRFVALQNCGVAALWCDVCSKFVGNKAKHEATHTTTVQLRGPFTEILAPTALLTALQDDRGEAQYWFSNDTIDVLLGALTREKFDSVLCVGAPLVFERLRQLSKPLRAFLLDIDDRLGLFYDIDEFARYSMLVNHFFHARSRDELSRFATGARRLALVCDPPFGVHVRPLMRSLDAMQTLASEANPSLEFCKSIVFLPLFVGKHVLRDHTDFSMVDYRVTYENHREFTRADRSIVRMFTNMENRRFELPAVLGYRYCKRCKRSVAAANKHCSACKRCTSLDGTPYKHCKVCGKCVKGTYEHCQKCKICHLQRRCPKTESEKGAI